MVTGHVYWDIFTPSGWYAPGYPLLAALILLIAMKISLPYLTKYH